MNKVKEILSFLLEKIKNIDYIGIFLLVIFLTYIAAMSIADNKNQRERLECFDSCTPYASKILENNTCWCFVDSNTLKKQTEQ